MSNTQKTVRTGGTNILGLLGVLFVGLKLTGHISWSWWWVTLPFWGGLAILVVILIVGALIVGLATVVEDVQAKKQKARRFA